MSKQTQPLIATQSSPASMITQAYTEALEKALGRVIADARRDVAQHASESRAVIAEMRQRITSLENELRESVSVRLAALKDGEKGDKGDAGDKGDEGKQGEKGEAGPQGNKGETGLPGERGTDGINGSAGEKGEAGERGVAGAIGSPGPRGEAGERGESGRTGDTGEKGDPGGRGEVGEKGLTGEQGPTGEKGLTGEQGLTGEKGEQGSIGERGLIGPEGKPGKLPIVKAWSKGIHYEGAVVTYNGSSYQAAKDTAEMPGESDEWIVLAAQGLHGSHGKDGVGFTIKGTYSPEIKQYRIFDVVACNSGSFVALRDGAGLCPGPDWQLLAGPGKRGDKGLPGEKGLKGEQGPPGITLAGWIVNAKSFEAQPVMSDGTKGPAIKMRDLFEQFLNDTH